MLNDLKKCCGTETSSNKNIVESPYAIIAEAMEEEERASNTQNVPKPIKKTVGQKVQNKVIKVVAKLCGNSSAKETISLIETSLNQNRTSDAQNVPEPTLDKSPAVVNKHTRKYEYVTYKDAVKNLSKSSEHHLNEKKFLDKSDKETQSFIDVIQKEVIKHIPRSSIEDIKLRGRKDKSFTAWVLLKKDSEPFKVDESFLKKASKHTNLKVTAVTLLSSSEEERGLRISLDENKARLYEIVNGSYGIEFYWKVGNKDCSITADISSDGTVTYNSPSKDLTFEDLEKNKAVKIRIGGVKNKEMTLAELISLDKSLCKSSSEEVKIQSQGSSKIKNLVAKSPEAKAALETLGLQLQQGSPKEKSVQTESPKAADVPRWPLTNITNVNTPQKLQSPDDKVIVPFGLG